MVVICGLNRWWLPQFNFSLSLGFVVGYILLFGWPEFWPSESSQWFFYLAILGGVWPRSDAFIFDLMLKAFFLLSMSWLMFKPLFQYTYSLPQGAVIIGVMVFVGIFVWFYNELVESLFPSSIFALSHSLFIASLALLLILTGSASTSQMIGIGAACMGTLCLLSLFKWPMLKVASVLTILEYFFCLYAYYYVEVKGWYLLVLSLSLLIPYGLKVFKKRRPIGWELSFVTLISLICIGVPLVSAFLEEGPPY